MKIPFERTIANAYRFAFTNIITILGIGWFPFLLVALTAVGLTYAFLPRWEAALTLSHDKWSQTQLLTDVASLAGPAIALLTVTMVATAMVNVGVMRRALGQHLQPYYIFFSLGSQVWRLIGAYILVMFLIWGITLFLVFGITGLSILLSKVSPGAQVLGTTLMGIAAFCFAVYALVRVAFFLPAIVVAENHIGIGRSWSLGRGNFWRIVGIYLITSIPLAIANSTINQSLLQAVIGPQLVPMTGWPPDSAHPAMTPAEIQHYLTVLIGALGRIWPYLLAEQMLYFILLTGLSAGAIAIAYNFVTGGPEIAPPAGPKKANA